MNMQNANKMAKKPLPKMKCLKNTGALGVIAGEGAGAGYTNQYACYKTETCGCPQTGPACGATQRAGCSRVSVNNCPNG